MRHSHYLVTQGTIAYDDGDWGPHIDCFLSGISSRHSEGMALDTQLYGQPMRSVVKAHHALLPAQFCPVMSSLQQNPDIFLSNKSYVRPRGGMRASSRVRTLQWAPVSSSNKSTIHLHPAAPSSTPTTHLNPKYKSTIPMHALQLSLQLAL